MQINLWCFRIRTLNSAKELSKIVSINLLMGLILIHPINRRFIKCTVYREPLILNPEPQVYQVIKESSLDSNG